MKQFGWFGFWGRRAHWAGFSATRVLGSMVLGGLAIGLWLAACSSPRERLPDSDPATGTDANSGAWKVVKLSLGSLYSCALMEGGLVRCWGAYSLGQLGYGVDPNGRTPAQLGSVKLSGRVLSLDSGAIHNCAVIGGGVLNCWGNGSFGKLGYGDEQEVGRNSYPRLSGTVPLNTTVQQVATSGEATCVLLDDGGVKCWGWNEGGQLGLGSKKPEKLLKPDSSTLDLGERARQIVAGSYHFCVITESDRVRCWGANRFGQLGYGHTRDIGDDEPPAAAGYVDLGGRPKSLSGGIYYTCALLEGGKVRCWGLGRSGQLGLGNKENVGDNEPPSARPPLDLRAEVLEVASGEEHTCVLLQGGAVQCWGKNTDGQLGYGHVRNLGDDESLADLPDVQLGDSAVTIAAGGAHTCAALKSGLVKCWGDNVHGQLGVPGSGIGSRETPASSPPVPISTIGSAPSRATEAMSRVEACTETQCDLSIAQCRREADWKCQECVSICMTSTNIDPSMCISSCGAVCAYPDNCTCTPEERARCTSAGYFFQIPRASEASLRQACLKAVGRAERCAASGPISDCETLARTYKAEAQGALDCLANLPCDQSELACFQGAAGQLGHELCSAVSECSSCGPGVPEELNRLEPLLRDSPLQAGRECSALPTCAMRSNCITRWRAAVALGALGPEASECWWSGPTCQTEADCCQFPNKAQCKAFSGVLAKRCSSNCTHKYDCAGGCCLPDAEGKGYCAPQEMCKKLWASPFGAPCAEDADCGPSLRCLKPSSGVFAGEGPAGGLCTMLCDQEFAQETCNSRMGECLAFGGTRYCAQHVGGEQWSEQFPTCNNRTDVVLKRVPGRVSSGQCTSDAQCRKDLELCQDGQCHYRAHVCLPQCNSDEDCGSELHCNPSTGLCAARTFDGRPIGAACDPAAPDRDGCRGGCVKMWTGDGMCSELCRGDIEPACGWSGDGPADARCVTDKRGISAYCEALCDCNSQCPNPKHVCTAFPAADQRRYGRKGRCSLPPSRK